jgi:hypothetical protein
MHGCLDLLCTRRGDVGGYLSSENCPCPESTLGFRELANFKGKRGVQGMPPTCRSSTPARLVQALREYCGIEVDPKDLKATELRLAGNQATRQGNFPKAASLFTEVCFCSCC